ncbi:MAG: hypothetical protein Q9M23_00245, partial [Mariprofundaceae bacterium]|nr:hypothetical protein [Mariprofundaceae bacterium]
MNNITASAPDSRPPLLGMNFAELQALCAQAGVKPAHAETLRAHIFRHADQDIHGIDGLPQAFYEFIETNTRRIEPELRAMQQSEDGTCKMLLGMN